ncbi:MAG TPA: hypothetical protein EYO59_06100 [Chromatiaceae bacterium]|nr:hypothetical protein [Chromatiaceae bacterium]
MCNQQIWLAFSHPREHKLTDWSLAYINKEIHQYLPRAMNFTIADTQDSPLLPDHEKRIGKGCRTDIQNFADDGQNNTVFVHSNLASDAYHFDTLAGFALRWTTSALESHPMPILRLYPSPI